MEQKINTVTISTEEYKRLIIDAERADRKEKEIRTLVEAQKEVQYLKLYEQRMDELKREIIAAQAEASEYRHRYNELKAELGKICKPKKHWWN